MENISPEQQLAISMHAFNILLDEAVVALLRSEHHELLHEVRLCPSIHCAWLDHARGEGDL